MSNLGSSLPDATAAAGNFCTCILFQKIFRMSSDVFVVSSDYT